MTCRRPQFLRFLYFTLACALASACQYRSQAPLLSSELLAPILLESYSRAPVLRERLIRVDSEGASQRFTSFEEYYPESNTLTIVGLVHIGIKAFTIRWGEEGTSYRKNPVFDPLLDPLRIFSDLYVIELNSVAVGEILKRRGLRIDRDSSVVRKNSGEVYLEFEHLPCPGNKQGNKQESQHEKKGGKEDFLRESRETDADSEDCQQTHISYAGNAVKLSIQTLTRHSPVRKVK